MKRYTITQMADIFNVNRMQIVRLIDRLELKEVNQDRPHQNSPKYYDDKVFNKLKAEHQEQHSSKQEPYKISDSYATDKVDEVVEILKEQLEYERERVKDISARNKELINLLDQQQRLTLSYNDKIKSIETAIQDDNQPIVTHPVDEEVAPEPEGNIFTRIFKRKK